HNSLSGGLPLELVSSGSIIVLDVSFNRLRGDMQELPSSTPSRPLQVSSLLDLVTAPCSECSRLDTTTSAGLSQMNSLMLPYW
uniref:Uncharacterized protein n=1 Tax=Triticum urartu TaxID=4572 RepID=A0A8R7QR80_TRIUA